MNVVFITPEEPFHLPVFFDKILKDKNHNTFSVVIIRPIYKKNTWLSQTKRVINAFGFKIFLVEAIIFIYYKLLNFVSIFFALNRFYSVERVVHHYNCPIYTPVNINDSMFLETLKSISPDVIVSVSSPQIFKNDLIDIPHLGCINIHGSMLPKYRGILPSFWMLAHNEKKAGITIHYINKGIDEGKIILQREFDILPSDTLHSLVIRSKRLGAEALLEALKMLEQGKVKLKPNPKEKGDYFSWPTKEAVTIFRDYGRRVR